MTNRCNVGQQVGVEKFKATISIIVPTLSEEKYLEHTLRSLRTLKTIKNEIIVSDGGSRDRTVEIAKGHADKVLEYRGESRQTIAQARNVGAALANGDYFVFLDADVWIQDPEDLFAKALQLFESDRNIVGLTVKVSVSPALATYADRAIYCLINLGLRIKNDCLRVGESTGEFQMIRRNAFDSVNGFREDLVTREDADMFRRLSKVGRTSLVPYLKVFHSGRRAHEIGWPRLLFIWTLNTFWVACFGRSLSKEWSTVR